MTRTLSNRRLAGLTYTGIDETLRRRLVLAWMREKGTFHFGPVTEQERAAQMLTAAAKKVNEESGERQ